MTGREWWDDPAIRKFLRHAESSALPKITDSALTIHIVGRPDAKLAVELGFTLLLDKPLVLVVPPGCTVPAHLARAADDIVEWTEDPRELSVRVHGAVARVLGDEAGR